MHSPPPPPNPSSQAGISGEQLNKAGNLEGEVTGHSKRISLRLQKTTCKNSTESSQPRKRQSRRKETEGRCGSEEGARGPGVKRPMLRVVGLLLLPPASLQAHLSGLTCIPAGPSLWPQICGSKKTEGVITVNSWMDKKSLPGYLLSHEALQTGQRPSDLGG